MLETKISELKESCDKKAAEVENFDDVLKSFEKLWNDLDNSLKTPSNKPKLIYAIGQPGSGKTSLREYILKKENMILINGDDYRKFHPKHNDFMKDPKNYELKTRYFKNLLIQLLIAKCLDEKINFLLENTFLNKNSVNTTIKQAKENGFSIEINVLDVNPIDSWISVNYRMLEMKNRGDVIRNVEKESFIKSYETIRKVILQANNQFIEFSDIPSKNIKVITREMILTEDHADQLILPPKTEYEKPQKLLPKTVNTIRTIQQKFRVSQVLKAQDSAKEGEINPKEKIPTTYDNFQKELSYFTKMLEKQRIKELLTISQKTTELN